MAEPFDHQPSPTDSPDPKSPEHDSPNNPKPTSSATASPPSKHPLTTPPSNKDKTDDDTATSEPREEEEEEEDDVEVELMDIVVLKDLMEYHKENGVYPFDDPTHMERFCSNWIRMGFGNAGGWKAKIEELKNKYKDHDGDLEPKERATFIMWTMVFGDQGN